MEAYFSAEQLFNFLREPAGKHGRTRYSLDPHNLSLALAGMPFIGWRESIRRCRRDREKPSYNRSYAVFRAIRYIVENGSTADWERRFVAQKRFRVGRAEFYRECWTNHFKIAVPELKGDHLGVRDHLMEHWRFLRRAVETHANDEKKHLPFLISAAFGRNLTSQAADEVMLAKAERLTNSWHFCGCIQS
jgi:hypothetical protein